MARKPLMAGLIAVSMLANLSSSVAPNYLLLLASRCVAGLVVATFFGVAVSTAFAMAPAGKQGSTVAKVTLGLNLGIVLGAPLGTVIGHNLGWRTTFAAVAVASAFALAGVLRFVPAQQTAAAGSVRQELRVFAARDLQLAIALTAVGNLGIVMVFTYIAPLLTDISGFAPGSIPLLLLVYGAGAVAGNFLGGWLSDRALMPSLIGLLAALATSLALFWLVSRSQPPAVIMTFVIGVLAFAILPGLQTRVMSTASSAPTLAVAVNASGFQLAAAFAGLLGGWVIDGGPGLRALYLVGALFTGMGVAIAWYAGRRDQSPAPAREFPGQGIKPELKSL
jgi:DHA1 family inner membrane transport protein